MKENKGRNFLKFLGAYLIGVLLAAVGLMSLSSCEQFSRLTGSSDTAPDSAFVATQVEAIVNPSFTTVQELIVFRQSEADEYSLDETFRSMSLEVLTNVATVCINRDGSVSKRSCVAEYRANKQVYDNLAPNDNPSTSVDATTPDPAVEQPTEGGGLGAQGDKRIVTEKRDTVIDGNPTEIITYRIK